jgi:O-antigen/teichoic acid export membrane protein
MIGFSTWSLLGSSATMLKNQGINILINIFFGPIVNAANAIAYQVNSALISFSNNFMTALKPQIIKSYASNEHERMKSLIFRGGKFSFFLLMILSIPILLETNIILHLWLKNVPEYTVVLTRLVILLTLIECFAYTISTGIQATGKIKNYLLLVSGTHLLNFPLTYLFFKLGSEPYVALIISIILSAITIFIRLFFIKKLFDVGIGEYSREVLLLSFIVSILSSLLPLGLHLKMHDGIERFIVVSVTSIISSFVFIYFLGISNVEKTYVNSIIKKKMHL